MREKMKQLLTDSGTDGANNSDGILPALTDCGDLLEAWRRERGQSIERALVLSLAQNFLGKLIAEDEIAPKRLREAKRLLRAIAQVKDDAAPAGEYASPQVDGTPRWIG